MYRRYVQKPDVIRHDINVVNALPKGDRERITNDVNLVKKTYYLTTKIHESQTNTIRFCLYLLVMIMKLQAYL